jgi:hypothetical protein
MRPRRLLTLLVAVAALNILLPRTASAIYIRHDIAVANYAALASDPIYAATGYLRSAGGQFCTGTLISPTTVLSSAHCFVFPSGAVAVHTQVMFGLGDTIADFASNVSSLVLNPLFNPLALDVQFDLALLTLSSPINGVTPAKLWAGNPLGLAATIIGYGDQGTGVSHVDPVGAPRKLAAQNVIDMVASDSLQFDFDRPDGFVCTNPPFSTGCPNLMGGASPLLLEGTPATGDSGSPLFALVNGSPFIVGTLFGGQGSNLYSDRSFYNRVALAENMAFLTENGVTFSTPVPEPGTLVLVGLGLGAAWRRGRARARRG